MLCYSLLELCYDLNQLETLVDLLVSENADKKQINGSSSGILSGVVVCVKVLTYNSKTSYSYLLIRPTLEQSNQM